MKKFNDYFEKVAIIIVLALAPLITAICFVRSIIECDLCEFVSSIIIGIIVAVVDEAVIKQLKEEK